MTPSLQTSLPPATFSPCRLYRYTLTREVAPMFGSGILMVIGLNPSTADETANDPTIRRCMRFAEDWGMRHYLMCNLFAFRSTDPAVMKAHPSPIGPDNDTAILDSARAVRDSGGKILCAWGTHGEHMDRAAYVTRLLTNRKYRLYCLGTNSDADASPCHPLYIPANTQPEFYTI